MNFKILPNGNLKITANNADRANLSEAYRLGGYQEAESLIAEAFQPNGDLYFIPPEDIGALTDAPILSDDWILIEWWRGASDDGAHEHDERIRNAKVWWFPDYAIRDPWEELKNIGYVIFESAAAVSRCPIPATAGMVA